MIAMKDLKKLTKIKISTQPSSRFYTVARRYEKTKLFGKASGKLSSKFQHIPKR
tara:strand:- start:736 stop:897 length:162 start_codon:yes stop_codon:yes gene_type:complete